MMSERSEQIAVATPPRRVTLEQVASAAGLARTTVSDILNRNVGDKYSRATRDRVLKAVRTLGYTPSRAAQVMARGRSGLVGLLLTRDFSNPFWARVANFVEQELRSRTYRMQLAVTEGNPEQERKLIQQLDGDQVEGLIIGPVYESIDLEEHHNVLRGRLPTVLFGGFCDSQFDNVALDHEAGKGMAITYLQERGHRRVGYLCAPPSRLRPDQPNPAYPVYRMFEARGLLQPQWFTWQNDTGRFEDFYQTCGEFVKRWKQADPATRPTAVICHNDQVAMTAYRALHEAGLSVPGDLSMVGYDNLPETAYLPPPLTTVDNQVQQQMRALVQRLVERLDHPRQTVQQIMIRPTLVERASVRRIG